MIKNPIVTLTTDFGLKDPFAGLMKAVILGINPNAKIVDITHNIQRHNIFEAAQVVQMSHKYFPSATTHVAVVDPGVGGIRRPILVVTEDHYFIGPDNGLFSTVFEEQPSNFFKVYHLTASHYFLPMSGSTFHGRDIFAPVAAWLTKGVDSHKFGDEIHDYHKIETPVAEIRDNSSIAGEIVCIDIFGNAISNIKRDDMARLAPADSLNAFTVMRNDDTLPFVNYYAEKESGELSALINSFGHVELFTFRESASDKHNIAIGDRIIVRLA